jgi:tRNA threonylcarbamoyl adenosine modification protein YeaZ
VLILALDTCDVKGSAAVLRDGEVLQTLSHATSEDYSSWLLRVVTDLLKNVRLQLSEIDAYAVAAGPGSFTGVRVGLTTVKAWAEVYGGGIAAVSRLDALATQALGAEARVAALLDARRGQVFGALYTRRADRLEKVGDEMVVSPEKFISWVTEHAGADKIRWVSTDATSLNETRTWAVRQSLGETVDTVSPLLAPVIGGIGYQLALAKRLTTALALDANYVRRSDAEVSWHDRVVSR